MVGTVSILHTIIIQDELAFQSSFSVFWLAHDLSEVFDD